MQAPCKQTGAGGSGAGESTVGITANAKHWEIKPLWPGTAHSKLRNKASLFLFFRGTGRRQTKGRREGRDEKRERE